MDNYREEPTELQKALAKNLLYPTFGNDWESVYNATLERKAKISQLELQISQMGSREIAEWVYELQEKQDEMV